MTHDSKRWLPQDIDRITMAFPASVRHLMPAYEEIPDEFRNLNSRSKWARMFSDWFYAGLKDIKTTPKPGIDSEKALRHVGTIMGSFEPKHEHKEAACAYLLSLWFDDVSYTVAERGR
jgi:hypothetical protein